MSMNTTLLMFPVSRSFNKMMLLFRSFSMSHSRCGKGIVGEAPVTGYVNRVVLEQQRLGNHLRCDRLELVDVYAENALALLAIIIALHHLSKQHPVQLGRHRHNVRHTVRDHVLSQTHNHDQQLAARREKRGIPLRLEPLLQLMPLSPVPQGAASSPRTEATARCPSRVPSTVAPLRLTHTTRPDSPPRRAATTRGAPSRTRTATPR